MQGSIDGCIVLVQTGRFDGLMQGSIDGFRLSKYFETFNIRSDMNLG